MIIRHVEEEYKDLKKRGLSKTQIFKHLIEMGYTNEGIKDAHSKFKTFSFTRFIFYF